MVDFAAILGKKATDIEKPLPKPTGTYLGQITGMPEQRTVTVNGEERGILARKVRLIMPLADVDQSAIGSKGIGEITSWAPFSYDSWIDTPEGEFQYREFLVNVLGIDPGTPKNPRSLGEMAAEEAGKQLSVTIIHKPYTNKSTGQPEIAANIGAVAKA